MSKLWGGRFEGETDALAHRFNASLPFDARLYQEDIDGSVAWAQGLATAGILSQREADTLVDGLETVRRELATAEANAEPFPSAADDEDIHTLVERRLTELVGPLGGKLHTGRSRNDQVATDFRLWAMRATVTLQRGIRQLQEALLAQAQAGVEMAMPGYTHLQQAQPVSWGHWTLSHFWPLQRDIRRFKAAGDGAAVLPLGAAALAGTTVPVDREALAQMLGFDRVAENSLDAVSDRDFAADFLYAAALCAVHLSRLAEQLIIFSSHEFGFVQLDDQYSTGSSLMPQKRNPDPLELTRGKAGRLIGRLTGLLTTLKGLPSTYDKDLQEDKEPLFDAYDTLMLALPVLAGALRTLQPRPEAMAAQLQPGLLATDLADYLVEKGVPFRQAHRLVGEAVRRAEVLGCSLAALPLEEYQLISEQFTDDVAALFDIQAALARRNVRGGTAPDAVRQQLELARALLDGAEPSGEEEEASR